MKRTIIMVLVLTFVSVCLAEVPIAEQPVYSSGDTWVYIQKNEKKSTEKKVKLEFLRVDSDRYVFLKNEKKEYITDFNLTIEKRKSHGRYPGPVIKFPLEKGKKWSYTHLAGEHGGPDFSKRSIERTTTFEVVAYEQVTVPAGTFWAFKVVATVEGGSTLRIYDRGTHTYWYAPDVKQIVKSNEYRIGTMELKKYILK